MKHVPASATALLGTMPSNKSHLGTTWASTKLSSGLPARLGLSLVSLAFAAQSPAQQGHSQKDASQGLHCRMKPGANRCNLAQFKRPRFGTSASVVGLVLGASAGPYPRTKVTLRIITNLLTHHIASMYSAVFVHAMLKTNLRLENLDDLDVHFQCKCCVAFHSRHALFRRSQPMMHAELVSSKGCAVIGHGG